MSKLAAGLIIFRKVSDSIEYLLMQTSYGDHHWTPPKGHLDEGESALSAALRETQEEAGLLESRDYTILNRETFSIVSNYVIHGVKPKQVTYWLARVNDAESVQIKMSEEHQDFKWLNLNQACEIVGYDEMKRVLSEAERFIKENVD